MFQSDLISMFFPAQCVGCDEPLDLGDRLKEASKCGDESQASVAVCSWLADRSLTAQARAPEINSAPGFDFELAFQRHWCQSCWSKLSLGSEIQCERCAATLRQRNSVLEGCAFCHQAGLQFESAISLGNYGGLLQHLVVRMKNQRDEPLAMQLAHVMAREVIRADFFGRLDWVVPVPTHWQRRLTRGFSAAEILAETVSQICGIELNKHLLNSTRMTEKQGTMSISGRKENVKNAFGVQRGVDLSGQQVLVVDDVMTSGATVSEIAKVLKRAGATAVFVAVIARGTGVR